MGTTLARPILADTIVPNVGDPQASTASPQPPTPTTPRTRSTRLAISPRSAGASYSYEATHIHAVTTVGAAVYTYDGKGNMLTRSTQTFTVERREPPPVR